MSRLPDAPGTDGPPDPVEKTLTFSVRVCVDIGGDAEDAIRSMRHDIDHALNKHDLGADVDFVGMEDA